MKTVLSSVHRFTAPLAILFATVILIASAGAESTDKKPKAVRQRFVPGTQDPSKGNGANWSELHQINADKPGVLMLMAHAGVGDSFPVQEPGQPKAFEVAVISGDDDHLVLEVQGGEKPQRVDLRRDATARVEVKGERYALSYPSVTVNAQDGASTDKALIIVNRFPPIAVSAVEKVPGVRLYSMKFDGGLVREFRSAWQQAFPGDNFVVTEGAQTLPVPAFEVRNMRLKELADSIKFLGEGALSVEVVEDSPANLWRIGSAAADGKTAELKMRAVAAPNIFAIDGRLDRVLDDAAISEHKRTQTIALTATTRGELRYHQTSIEPLRNQKILVLIGDEAGLSGMESFLKACEQTATQDESKIEREIEAKRVDEINARIMAEQQRRQEEAEARRRKMEEEINRKVQEQSQPKKSEQ
jgi:hypothetical protein